MEIDGRNPAVADSGNPHSSPIHGAPRQSTSASSPSKDEAGTPDATPAAETQDAATDPKMPWWKTRWASLGLDWPTVFTMAKGACSPVVALALFQYPPFAARFPTIGYLVAISAVISMPILPRAKYLQTMLLNIIGICIGACVALLTCYCSVQARISTGPATPSSQIGASGTQQAVEYNSSASAVAGIWLFVNILFANALRFSRPQLQTPVILYSIFANISGTFAPHFGTMTQSIAFVEMLLEAFLSGFGVSLVIHFVFFPRNGRHVIFAEYKGYIKLIQGVLAKQRAYLEVMEHSDMLDPIEKPQGSSKKASKTTTKVDEAADGLRASLSELSALHSKIRADLAFAKREAAYGKLGATDLKDIFQHFRRMLLPLLGLSSVSDIFGRLADGSGWRTAGENTEDETTAEHESTLADERNEWNEIMQALHQPFQDISQVVSEGLEHALYVLELDKPPKDSVQQTGGVSDLEAAAVRKPGEMGFAEHLETKLQEFNNTRKAALRTWCSLHNISVEASAASMGTLGREQTNEGGDSRYRRQLYLILYIEYVLGQTARSALAFIQYADSKVADGTMKSKRFVTPGKRRILKWLKALLAVEDASNDTSPDNAEAGINTVALGDAFYKRKDPEHLPPTNPMQRVGDKLRVVTNVMGQIEVRFGFRVACATMSIAILAYLEQTQAFFVEQRVVWAMIMVAIGMTMTTGSGVFTLVLRVFGTFVAMCTSLAIWYAAGGRGIPGAVLPLLYLVCFAEMYILVKYPRLVVVAIISIVTQILILGYELQADKIGIKAISSNGMLYYPVYTLAPYRLGTVAAGRAIAFIWTYFPYPLTARTALRQQLGEAVYLLANYYSCVHTTIQIRVADSGGDPKVRGTPAFKLEKAREEVLAKILGLLVQLRQHSQFIPFELALGGKFPKETYDALIAKTQHLVDYIALFDYSTRIWDSYDPEHDESEWSLELKGLVGDLEISSHDIVSLLTMVSSSLLNSTPLPPYLRPPKPYRLAEQVYQRNRKLLGVQNILERGYGSFAVTQVASRLVDDDIQELLRLCKMLVGEVDFSFHIISTTASSSQATLFSQSASKSKRE